MPVLCAEVLDRVKLSEGLCNLLLAGKMVANVLLVEISMLE